MEKYQPKTANNSILLSNLKSKLKKILFYSVNVKEMSWPGSGSGIEFFPVLDPDQNKMNPKHYGGYPSKHGNKKILKLSWIYNTF